MTLLDPSALKGVLFDIDGTLVDTTYLHAVCWADAMRQFGHRVPMARIHRCVGMGTEHLLAELLPGDRDQSTDGAIEAAHAALMATHWNDLVALPGAADLLGAVSRAGLQVLLASSASGRELEALLGALGDPDGIDVIATASDADHSKPDPDILQVALDNAGLEPAEVVFVGDAVWDVHASAKLQIGCIGLTCGGTSAGELRDAGAVEVYADPAELLDQTLGR